MSRFGNLEFGAEHEDSQHNPPGAAIKGEAHYFAEAKTAFENGSFESALRLFSKVLEFNPQNAAAWTGQVRMLIEMGELKEARLWAEKALEKFPREAELLAAKGVALARSGDLQGALAFSDSAIEQRGDTPYVWLARGDVLLARKESRAEFCFEKAMTFAPGDWFLTWLSGRIRFFYKQFAQAVKLMQRAVETNAGHFMLWLELGRCQQALGLIGPARHSFTQAKQLSPQHADTARAFRELDDAGIFSNLAGWFRNLFRR